MDRNSIIECGGFYFIHNFDSGNLGHVERVPTEFISSTLNPKTNTSETPDYEFNLWTRPDCAGTEFENGNRTWFYFGVQASEPNIQVRFNLINLNKQGKMYNQGMAPVTRTLPGKPQWERIRDRPVHSTDDNTFTLSFRYRTADNPKATTFFAFTYPFSFAELQIALNTIDLKMLPLPPPQSPDDIYYCRECLIYSLEGRRVDLLTISSHHGITSEREDRLKNLFPENQKRPFKFQNKKVIFISARVHPGETPSSFVFNGFLNLLLTRNDPIAIQLRKLYVFKMVPFLNPDGVARGHYRTDTRGVNLNRVYLNPSLTNHPTVYASRSLIRYHHFGFEKEEDIFEESKSFSSRSIQNISEGAELTEIKKKKISGSPTQKDSLKRNKSKVKAPVFRTASDEPLGADETHLAEQVFDMKLQEMPQTSDVSSNPSNANIDDNSSLLDDNVLRSCLGSNVHLSTSEELNVHGLNPLKPLRETLKNSISLLMESNSSALGESLALQPRVLRMGWCRSCRLGRDALLPSDSPAYSNIEEYGEHQRQLIDDQEQKLNDVESAEDAGNAYFCTNCFKRYVITDYDEELAVTTSSDEVPAPLPPPPAPTGSTGDSLPPIVNIKIDKPKSANKPVKKKPPPGVPPTQTSPSAAASPPPRTHKDPDSGLYLYIDLHGHASKKGIFMYGNHFEDLESSVECMLLPRIMSLNNLHFHFSSCNFTERNMYLKDRRDGMSREGSGRVAVLKATGLVRSYTLECNYNTGRLVNALPPPCRDHPPGPPNPPPAALAPPPPKYTPHIFEEVGRSLGASILDLTAQHPNSRIPCSEHRTLAAVRDWLRTHSRTARPQVHTHTHAHTLLKWVAPWVRPSWTSRRSIPTRASRAPSTALWRLYATGCAHTLAPRAHRYTHTHTHTHSSSGSFPGCVHPGPHGAASQLAHPVLRAPHSGGCTRLAAHTLSHRAPTGTHTHTRTHTPQVGRSLGASILDLTAQHPNSRIPCSEHRTLAAVRDWLRTHSRTARPQLTTSRLRPKTSSPTRAPPYARSKAKATEERKENAYAAAKSDSERRRSPPGLDLANLNAKFAKKNDPAKSSSRTRHLADGEPKPRTLSTKRRNILAIRKPNAAKTQPGGIVKAKTSRRPADDAENPRSAKRGFARSLRARRPAASSSSEEAAAAAAAGAGGAGGSGSWDASLASKRRPFPNPAPAHLKKIRLKSGS